MNGIPPFAPFLPQAIALHQRLPVASAYFEYYGYDSLFKASGGAQCDLEKLDAAHVRTFGIALANGGGPALAVGPGEVLPIGDPDWALARLIRLYDAAMAHILCCPRVRIVRTASDLNPAAGDDTIRVIPLVTSHLWMRDLTAIDLLFERGLRISHCSGETWCRSYPLNRVKGVLPPVLSDFGRQVVARMNERGIVLDMAHLSDESTDAIVEASTRPVIDGHTGSRTVIPDCRGHRDATLRKMADRGGVAGIHFADHLFTARVWGRKYNTPLREEPQPIWAWHRHLLDTLTDPEERMALRKNRAAQQRFFEENHIVLPPPACQDRIATVADMADQVEHLVRVMGADHVGLGGDVNGITPDSWPLGMDHVGELPHLTAELLRRGHPEDELEKFLCHNWRRVLQECLPP